MSPSARVPNDEDQDSPLRASIIIPAYNAQKTLPECLAACLAQDYPAFEVIVVDDGSTDDTGIIAVKFEAVQYHLQPNGGPSSARNTGARLATGDILVYTDADCVPRRDWLTQLTRSFEEGVVAVGGTYDIANPASRLARVVQAEIANRHQQFKGDVDFLGSFNVAYRRSAFEAVDGFNPSYRQASGEDNDLAYRLHDTGGRMVFNPQAIVAHYHPERLFAYLRTQARHGYWRVKLYQEHPRRARGDHYAGWPDLVAPPLGIALPFLLILVAAAGHVTESGLMAVFVGLCVVLAYAALHAPLVLRLRQTLPVGDLLYFLMVACLRDIARAIGLLKGLWTFSSRIGSRI